VMPLLAWTDSAMSCMKFLSIKASQGRVGR
jgi:hypothetical protein